MSIGSGVFFPQSLIVSDRVKAPGIQGFRRDLGLAIGSLGGKWWWTQSRANSSLRNSLFNREKTGKIVKFYLVFTNLDATNRRFLPVLDLSPKTGTGKCFSAIRELDEWNRDCAERQGKLVIGDILVLNHLARSFSDKVSAA